MGSSSGRHVAKWEVLLGDMSRNGKLYWAFGQRIFREMKDLAIVVKIEYCFDLPVHRSSPCVWSGISRRFHVFFKRPSKKRRGYAGEWSSPRPCLRRERATARARARVMARRVATKQGQPDIHIYVKEGFSSRCHVFFKRPSKKRSVSIVLCV